MKQRSAIDVLLGIPPLERRPAPGFMLNHFAVPGYDPHSVEGVILYKSFVFSACIVAGAIFVYYLPVGFGFAPDLWGLRLDRPVEYFKDDFPGRIVLPTIFLSCAYAALLACRNYREHGWRFSDTRPAYLQNLQRIRSRRFPIWHMALLHVAGPLIFALIFCAMNLALDFFNNYRLVRAANDFDAQTSANFAVIAVVYFAALVGSTSNIFAFVTMLALERVYRHQLKDQPPP